MITTPTPMTSTTCQFTTSGSMPDTTGSLATTLTTTPPHTQTTMPSTTNTTMSTTSTQSTIRSTISTTRMTQRAISTTPEMPMFSTTPQSITTPTLRNDMSQMSTIMMTEPSSMSMMRKLHLSTITSMPHM